MSREEAIVYGEKFGIPAPVSKKSPYSIDVNLLGRSIEAGILEDPMQEAPEDIFSMTSSIDNTPDSPLDIEIVFKNGFPVGINDEFLTPVEIIQKTNHLAGNHGFGRISENNSLYREDLATYSKEDVFNHSLAEGFIYMWGMSNKIWAELNSKIID